MTLRLSRTWTDGVRDGRELVEVVAIVVVTWLLLGWWFGEPLVRGDGPRLFAPYLRSALDAGSDWTANAYRFGAFGGSVMHPAFGTSPLVLVCGALGASPTTAGNVTALFDQVCLGFFGLVMVKALLSSWSGAPRSLAPLERVVTVLCCAFAPFIGWRYAAGHPNLIEGLLPFVVGTSLWWAARARTLSWSALLVGWLAVFHALPSLGQQTMVYSVVFGAPVILVTLAAGGTTRFVPRQHTAVMLVFGGAVLCAAPLVVDMISYQLGDDASRGTRSMFYGYGHPFLADWLTSVPWTLDAALRDPAAIRLHETNYPIGPLVLLALALWPRKAPRDLGFALLMAALLAIAFALDVDPIAPLLRRVPLVDAFRVPARAIMPALVLLPVLGMAALWDRCTVDLTRRQLWIALAALAVAMVAARWAPSLPRELAGWLAAAVVCISLRGANAEMHRLAIVAALVALSALGVAAFDERYATARPAARIEDEPAALRRRVLAEAPDLAMPLTRIEVPGAPPPFEKSLAFAAGLPTLDGVGFPPRRFLELLSVLWNKRVSPAEADFDLTSRERFDVLAQLYNVRYVLGTDGRLQRLAATNGAAWFVRDVTITDDPREMLQALTPGSDLQATLARTAWVTHRRAPTDHTGAGCANARVTSVTADALGQQAELLVQAPDTCLLVVATSYATTLRATTVLGTLDVLPVDVSLTGILVPAGSTRIELGPAVERRWWWALLGCLVLAAAVTMHCRRSRGPC